MGRDGARRVALGATRIALHFLALICTQPGLRHCRSQGGAGGTEFGLGSLDRTAKLNRRSPQHSLDPPFPLFNFHMGGVEMAGEAREALADVGVECDLARPKRPVNLGERLAAGRVWKPIFCASRCAGAALSGGGIR